MDRYSIALGKETVWDRPIPSKPPLIRKIITGAPGTGKTQRLLEELCMAPEEKSLFVHLGSAQAHIRNLIDRFNMSVSSHFFSFMFWDTHSDQYSLIWDNLQGARFKNLYLDTIDFGRARSVIGILSSLASVSGIPKIVVNCDIRSLQEALGYITQKTFSRHISVQGVKWVVDNLTISMNDDRAVQRAIQGRKPEL